MFKRWFSSGKVNDSGIQESDNTTKSEREQMARDEIRRLKKEEKERIHIEHSVKVQKKQ
jgi:hypothetical protein